VLDMLDVDLGPEQRALLLETVAAKFISTLTIESIIDQISVLNPNRVVQEVEAVLHRICQALDLHPARKVTLRFMIHCCCMVERLVIDREPLPTLPAPAISGQAYSVLKSAFAAIESAYNIRLSDTEYHYIFQLLFT